jgi:hypothetical protein
MASFGNSGVRRHTVPLGTVRLVDLASLNESTAYHAWSLGFLVNALFSDE